ncbi:ureidoglycolate hydrolase [Xylariales sp. PMI_506]|nr:ureidoglycolate hydrolase [Xylariales sp. PMI_506]
MIVQTVPIPPQAARQVLTPTPLTRAGFAPFGTVVANPRPEAQPHNTSPESIAAGALPCGALSANQGSAIQYRDIAPVHNLYAEAPSGVTATPRMTMFVCGARELAGPAADCFEVKILERHPFTTQTFTPLAPGPGMRYMVIVAPSLPPSDLDKGLPVPRGARGTGEENPKLPGRGVPDLSRLQAFIASGNQAVTYGAGTWHAPMVVLGPRDTSIDFVVVQFANGTAIEDCQEVTLETQDSQGGKLIVRVPKQALVSKL